MTTPTTSKAVTARKPQDRQPSKSELAQAAEQPPLGADTLIPVVELRSARLATVQADLLELFEEAGINLEKPEEVEIETTTTVLRAFGKISNVLESCVHEENLDAFAKFDSGAGAVNRIVELAMWYLGQMGESVSSAS